jgi:hypothetical protein
MARSHHRKKHREHVRQFRQSHDMASPRRARGKASSIFLIIGALGGAAVAFFAAEGNFLWLGIGIAAGALAGYFIGRSIDSSK